MKNIFSIGINHTTASIEVRERFFLTDIEQDLLLSELKGNPSIIEGFVLSTCNRTEVYVHVLDGFDPFLAIYELLINIKKIEIPDAYQEFFYTYRNQKAVEHLFRVAAALDSLVLGEKQILGQVKRAVENAQKKAFFSKKFNILSNVAIRTGKKVQNETALSYGGTSVSWAAVIKAEEVLGELANKKILLIGAGKMSELAVGQIQNKNFAKLYLMNRTESHAKALAQKYGGEIVGLCDIKDILTEIDMCICSSAAPHYILEKSTVEKVLAARNNRKLLFIDISMPRNIDPEVSDLENVLLYEIDDLNQVVDSSMKVRKQAISQVEAIVADKLKEYVQKIDDPQTVTV